MYFKSLLLVLFVTVFFYGFSVNALSNGGMTTSLKIAILNDVSAPSSPKNVNALISGESLSVILNWSIANDNIAVHAYHIYRNGDFLAVVSGGQTLEYTDDTVEVGHHYEYSISAIDAAGNQSALSSYVIITIPAASANTPKSLSMYRGEIKLFNLLTADPEVSSFQMISSHPWISFNQSDNSLTLSPTVATHTRLSYKANYAEGQGSIVREIELNVYPRTEEVADIVSSMPKTNYENVIQTQGLITHTSPQFFKNMDGSSWTVALAYFSSYSNDQQIFTIDLSTGELKQNEKMLFESENWHGFKAVPGPNGLNYINPVKGEEIQFHAYDTQTHSWIKNVVPSRPDHRGGGQMPRITVGTNGRIYSFGESNIADMFTVMEIDPNNNNATRFFENIPGTGDTKGVAADSDYVYVLNNPYGQGQITAIDLKTNERTVIFDGLYAQIEQRKHGVYFKAGSRLAWIYKAQLFDRSYPYTAAPPGVVIIPICPE